MQNLRYRLSKGGNTQESKSKPKPNKGKSVFFLGKATEDTPRLLGPSRAQFAMIPMRTASNALVADSKDSLAFLGWNRTDNRNQPKSRECCPKDRHWNIYFGPLGTVGQVHSKNGQPGFDDWSVGGLFGFDYAFNQGGIGILVDYENINGSVHQHWGKFDINQAHASFYGTYVPKGARRLSFDAIVGGGYDWYQIRRHTSGKTATGSPEGSEFDALVGLAYNAYGKQDSCGPKRFQFTPMANVQYIYVNTLKYHEHNAGMNNFNVHSQYNKSLRTTLGTWMSYAAVWKNFSFTPELYLAWQREFANHNHAMFASPLVVVQPTQSLSVIGAGRNIYQGGLDFMFTMFNKYGLEISYDFEWNTLFHDNAFYVGFNVEF